MNIATALKLGRVSNLPTVATNAMAGFILASHGMLTEAVLPVIAGAALAYVAGMFLNDAFDAEYDTRFQPYRPIPAGSAGRAEVFAWGFGLLAASLALFVAAGLAGQTGWAAGAAGLTLVSTIVVYNRHHKENPFGPVLMGICRLLVYLTAALAVVPAPGLELYLGAALLMAHVMGLTFIAKTEQSAGVGRYWPFFALAAAPAWGVYLALDNAILWPFVIALGVADIAAVRLVTLPKPDFGRAIPLLIAAITLLDGMFIAQMGLPALALLACLCFPLTLFLQRWVRGT